MFAQSVHGAQVLGGLLGSLPAGEEYDPRHRRRYDPAHHAQRGFSYFLHAGLVGVVLARQNHVRLEQHPLQQDAVVAQSVEDDAQRSRL